MASQVVNVIYAVILQILRDAEQFHGEGRAITVPIFKGGAGKVFRAFYIVDRWQAARPSLIRYFA